MRLASLKSGDKFTLHYNGRRYLHCGYNESGRIKVKAIGHCVSPVISQDMTNISCAPNAKVTIT